MAIAGLASRQQRLLESPAATSRRRVRCSSKPNKNTEASCKWATQQVRPPHHNRSRRQNIAQGAIGPPLLRQSHGTAMSENRSTARSPSPRALGMGSLARTSPAPALQRQRSPLQLALVFENYARRKRSTRHARSRCLPLGPRRRLSQTSHSSGGRYQFKDIGSFTDTLVTSFEYEDRTLSWRARAAKA